MAVIFPSYMSPSLFPFNRMSSGGERSEVAVGFGTSACLLVCLFLRQSTCLQLYGACEPRTPRRWVVCVCVCVWAAVTFAHSFLFILLLLLLLHLSHICFMSFINGCPRANNSSQALFIAVTLLAKPPRSDPLRRRSPVTPPLTFVL